MKTLFILSLLLFSGILTSAKVSHPNEQLNKIMKTTKGDYIIFSDCTTRRVERVSENPDSIGFYYLSQFDEVGFQMLDTAVLKNIVQVIHKNDPKWQAVNDKWQTDKDKITIVLLSVFAGAIILYIVFGKYLSLGFAV